MTNSYAHYTISAKKKYSPVREYQRNFWCPEQVFWFLLFNLGGISAIIYYKVKALNLSDIEKPLS
jgi:hypothetical protein